jgi:hypothetical protein
MQGVVTLVDVMEADDGDRAERERLRTSRLNDVMTILEANAAAIAAAVHDRLRGTEACDALDGVFLRLSDRAPTFIATFEPASGTEGGAEIVSRNVESLGAALETELLAAIQSRVSVNRLFTPAITLGREPLAAEPPMETQMPQPVPGEARPATRPHRAVSGAGRFWLVVLFFLIAAVLLTAGFLVAEQWVRNSFKSGYALNLIVLQRFPLPIDKALVKQAFARCRPAAGRRFRGEQCSVV